jgi:hypothetical protein
MTGRENPFVFGKIIDDANFVDRTDELNNLVRDLADGKRSFCFRRGALTRVPWSLSPSSN